MKTITPKLQGKLKEIKLSRTLLNEVANTILANKRAGNACTKTRAEVSGGGKKPWRQKGTGRARVGSNRSPIWKGGGITFGPTREQSFKKSIPRKKKQQAVLQMIAQRIREGGLKVAEKIEFAEPKTRLAQEMLSGIFGKEYGKILISLEERNDDIVRSFRNIKGVTIIEWQNLNAYDLLRNEKVLFTKKAWDDFVEAKGLQ
ncbi:MAG: 50S ribosomal protein L4 [Elusimicrobiota bacterium]